MAFPELGQSAPTFSAFDDAGNEVRLSDLLGKQVVLYFYPKADTPGCTKQACAFRDQYGEFASRDVVILGASHDTQEEQAAFKAKFQLPFTLLADPDHALCELYGVWGHHQIQREERVIEFTGIRRSTFIIDPYGKISHALIGVDPANNAREVLDILDAAEG